VSYSKKIAVVLFTLLFFYVEASQAALVRTSGRASLSRNDGQTIFYFGPESLNIFGVSEDAYFNRFSPGVSSIRSPIDENRGVAAVPGGPGGCIKGLQEQDVLDTEDFIFDLEVLRDDLEFDDPVGNAAQIASLDQQISNLSAGISNDPCTWEFEEGEPLELFGAFSMFFDVPEIDYAVSWNISGPGVGLSLPGDVNRTDIVTSAGDSFLTGSGVFLNAGPFPSLVAGNYNLSVDVSLTGVGGAPIPGAFFLESRDTGIEWDRECGPNPAYDIWFEDPANWVGGIIGDTLTADGIASEPEIDICGWNTFAGGPDPVSAPTSFFSASERLRILPASTGGDGPDGPGGEVPEAEVDTPSTLACAVSGLLLLGAGRRRRSIRRSVA